jgi:hypothetical protein
MGVPDTTPPVISNVQAVSIFIDSAAVSWTTDEPADSLVEYGTSPGNYTDNLSDLNLVFDHLLDLSNLSPATTYYYRVTSTDEAGNTAVSDEYTFTTLDIMTNTIFMEKYKKANDVHADAVITVTANGVPVEGALVEITWTDSYIGTDQAFTDANGEVKFRSGPSHPNKWSFTITVDNITKAGYWWDAANSETTETLNKHKHKDY